MQANAHLAHLKESLEFLFKSHLKSFHVLPKTCLRHQNDPVHTKGQQYSTERKALQLIWRSQGLKHDVMPPSVSTILDHSRLFSTTCPIVQVILSCQTQTNFRALLWAVLCLVNINVQFLNSIYSVWIHAFHAIWESVPLPGVLPAPSPFRGVEIAPVHRVELLWGEEIQRPAPGADAAPAQSRNCRRHHGDGTDSNSTEDVTRCDKMWQDVRRCEKMWESEKCLFGLRNPCSWH